MKTIVMELERTKGVYRLHGCRMLCACALGFYFEHIRTAAGFPERIRVTMGPRKRRGARKCRRLWTDIIGVGRHSSTLYPMAARAVRPFGDKPFYVSVETIYEKT